jgi:hypothetical protein
MIYADAPSITFPVFTGGDPDNPATPDVMRFARASDHLVLEDAINAIGVAEANAGRYLGGIQVEGGGMSLQFMAQMLFTQTGQPLDMDFAVGEGMGLRAFCFYGEDTTALRRSKELARQRMLTFVGLMQGCTYRGCEIGGAGDGLLHLGLILVRRFEQL